MPAAARMGLLLSVSGAALFWTTSLVAGFTLPKLAAAWAGLAVSAAALALSRPAPERPTDLDLPVGACLAALAVSLAYSLDSRLSLLGRYDNWSHGLWSAFLYAGALFTAAAALRGRELWALRGLAVLGALLSLDALAQRADLDPMIRRSVLPTGRAIATLGSPVDLGAWLALAMPAALEAALALGAAAWALPAALAAGLWATGSRGAALGACAGSAVFLLLAGLAPFASLSRRARGLAAAALVCGSCLLPVLIPARGDSDRGRVEVWKAAWAAFKERPAVGSGPDTFEPQFRRLRAPAFVTAMRRTTSQQAYAHNDFLQALATTGLAGAAAYLLLLLALARLAWSAAPDRAAAAAAGGLAALFFNLKLNPVSMEVQLAAAAVAGLLLSSGGRARRPARGLFLGAAALALVSCAAAARMWRADLAERAAVVAAKTADWDRAVAAGRKALSLSPCESSYALNLVNHASGAINGSKDAARRLELLTLAREAGARAARCAPVNADAFHTLGVAELFSVQLGLKERLPFSEAALDRAQELDPLFAPIVGTRLDAARLRGDKQRMRALEARQAELHTFVTRP